MSVPAVLEKECICFGRQDLHDPVHIAYGVDDTFAMPMGVSITSILVNNAQIEFSFHVLTDGIDVAHLRKLEAPTKEYGRCNIFVHIFDASFFDRFCWNYGAACVYRMASPCEIFKGCWYCHFDVRRNVAVCPVFALEDGVDF